jgi:acetyl-CoA acyltransferase
MKTKRLYQSVYVVDGGRTPFAKAYTQLSKETALDLSIAIAQKLLSRSGVKTQDLSEIIWGTVIPSLKHPNLARDIALFAGLPTNIPGYTLCRQCASSFQTVISAADGIDLGRYQLVLAGGVEHMSDVPILLSESMRRKLIKFQRARSGFEKFKILSQLRLNDLSLETPALQEGFTGLSMGQSTEKMAKENEISRLEQDEFTLKSHQKAETAYRDGYFQQEVIPYYTSSLKEALCEDSLVRFGLTLDDLSKLKPSFDKLSGSLTAGNSTSLTDGAAACLLASEEYVQRHHLPILGKIIGEATIAVDPRDQLLVGPAIAVPKLLEEQGLSVDDIDIFEIHEAFAAQILSCLKLMKDKTFLEQYQVKPLGRDIPESKLNCDGGSLAIGHPLAATGARLVTRALHLLNRKGGRYAVVSACAAGGLAQAILLEASDPKISSKTKNPSPSSKSTTTTTQTKPKSQTKKSTTKSKKGA